VLPRGRGELWYFPKGYKACEILYLYLTESSSPAAEPPDATSIVAQSSPKLIHI